MVALSDFERLSRPKTHIDELIARFLVPDDLDLDEARKINDAHASAIRNVVCAGLHEQYKLEEFRFNRDIRIPVMDYMGQQQPRATRGDRIRNRTHR